MTRYELVENLKNQADWVKECFGDSGEMHVLLFEAGKPGRVGKLDEFERFSQHFFVLS